MQELAAHGDEHISAEHVDKLILQDIRTEFYRHNSLFEQVLKFKPVRRVHLTKVDVSLEQSYLMTQLIRVDEEQLSYDERIRSLELELDLKEYYDIKRPTIVFFSAPKKYQEAQNWLTVTRYDILSETSMQTEIRSSAFSRFHEILWEEASAWCALSHPSNNQIYMVNGGDICLFDN